MSLLHKRSVWLPTFWGWILLLAIGVAAGVLMVRNLYPALAPNVPVGARILVVEGWLAPEELDQAIEAFRKGNYQRIVTTGGPILGWPELSIHTTYADVAADYLSRHGIPRMLIIAVPTPKSAQDRTFLSAVMLRDSASRLKLNLDAFDLFSSGPHARRSRLLYQMAFGPEVRIGVLAAKPAEYDPDVWWRTSSGMESMILQSLGVVWVKCFFWPGPRGSVEERWARSASPRNTDTRRSSEE